MGYEFSITSVDGHWAPQLVAPRMFLERFGDRSTGSPSVTFTAPDTCELRSAATATGMPDAIVQIEPTGFYFCDYSRSTLSRVLFSELVSYALASCDGVVVREL